MWGKEHGGVKMSDLYEEFLSFVASLLALGCFSHSTRSPFHSLALRLSFVSARLSSFHVSSGERSPVRQEHKDAR